MNNIFSCINGRYLNASSIGARLVYSKPPEGNAAQGDGETVEVFEDLPKPDLKQRELSDMYDGLTAKINEIKARPDAKKYESIIKIAEARLSAIKDYVPQLGHVEAVKPEAVSRMNVSEFNNILSSLRLSIIAANREEAAGKLAEVKKTLEAERDEKLKGLDGKYKELQDFYEGSPKTLAYLSTMYAAKKTDFRVLYADYISGAQRDFTGILATIGPQSNMLDIDSAFKTLFADFEVKLVTNLAPRKAAADKIVNLNEFVDLARGRFLLEKAEGRAYRHEIGLRMSEYELKMYDAGKDDPDSKYKKTAKLKEEMDAEFAVLDGKKLPAARHNEEEARLYAKYIDKFKAIRDSKGTRDEEIEGPSSRAIASYLEKEPGKKRVA